eukprot:933189-Lingulodinium_polyedra.AAC.1
MGPPGDVCGRPGPGSGGGQLPPCSGARGALAELRPFGGRRRRHQEVLRPTRAGPRRGSSWRRGHAYGSPAN